MTSRNGIQDVYDLDRILRIFYLSYVWNTTSPIEARTLFARIYSLAAIEQTINGNRWYNLFKSLTEEESKQVLR